MKTKRDLNIEPDMKLQIERMDRKEFIAVARQMENNRFQLADTYMERMLEQETNSHINALRMAYIIYVASIVTKSLSPTLFNAVKLFLLSEEKNEEGGAMNALGVVTHSRALVSTLKLGQSAKIAFTSKL